MKLLLYSTGCPMCNVLKAKLDSKGIEYEVHSDLDEMMDIGIASVPVLKVEDKYLSFGEAVAYVNSL